jgi:hypothetical protein
MKLILIILLAIFANCLSTQSATTARIQERSEYVTTNLDNAANDCLTENCKQAMKQAKELIKDSLDVIVDKDSEIATKQKQIDSESFYTKIGRFVFWGLIAIIASILLYTFRNQIFTLIKLVKPI